MIVNLWATWCPSCINELSSLQALKDSVVKTELDVIAISLDRTKTHEELIPFLVKNEIGLVALYHDHKRMVQGALGMEGLPATYILGRDGRILMRVDGDADWTSYETTDFLKSFLQLN